MFTGIVQEVGIIEKITAVKSSMRMRINAPRLDLSDVSLGDSVAVSGPCLTVTWFSDEMFEVDVSAETLARTTLRERKVGDQVNLEKALRFNDRLGGHLVSGHIDGVGQVELRESLDEYIRFVVSVPNELSRYLAFKGSVSLDGVSLTVNEAREHEFEVLTIPHTLENTTLGESTSGTSINVEVDLVARYLERLSESKESNVDSSISLATLQDAGLIE
ncbi:MAG TPA: riboflavin synthase [Dehalococcoidia bacterium]|nr:riboflavin synthase [Dehalococcoidia bacterium]